MFPFSGEIMFCKPVTVGPRSRSLLCRLVAGPVEYASKMTPSSGHVRRAGRTSARSGSVKNHFSGRGNGYDRSKA
jgi:hypothetical protein